mgnify:CR=1 FL=1
MLNVNIISSQLKAEEINRYRSKVISLSEVLLLDPGNRSCQALLNMTLKRLERLLKP